MITVSGPVAAALVAAEREVACRVTIGWNTVEAMDTTRLTASFDADRSVQDLPNEVGLVAGGTTAEATVILSGSYLNDAGQLVKATDLSPYVDKPWSTRALPNYGIGAPITIEVGVLVAGVWSWVTRFTGVVSDINPTSDGQVRVVALDGFDKVRGTLALPTAGGVVDPAPAGEDPTVSPLAVEDLALRVGGYCLTPPARPGALISVPNCGSPLPEVGEYQVSWDPASTVPGRFVPVCRTAGAAKSTKSVPSPVWVGVEGWFRRPLAAFTDTLFTFKLGGFFIWEVRLNTAGQVGPRTALNPYVWSASGAFSNDTDWHYVGVRVSATQVQVCVDGVVSTAPVSITMPADADEWGVSWKGTRAEGIQMWTETTPGGWNHGWAPNYTQDIEPTSARLAAIPGQTSPDAGQIVRELAQAEGAIVGFTENGTWRRETRGTWRARRIANPVRTISDGVEFWGNSWGSAGVRRAVSASVNQPRVEIPLDEFSTADVVWAATETYTCPAASAVTYQVSTEDQLLDLYPLANSMGGAGVSWFAATRASSVGDPAAVNLPNVTVRARPTVTGVDITITNPYPYEVALWTPGGGGVSAGPYLRLRGHRVRHGDPVQASAESGAAVPEDMRLPDNPWRQDTAATRALVSSIAAEVAMPAMLLPVVPIAGDPRLQLGDVVAINDATTNVDGAQVQNRHRLSDTSVPCLIVGVAESFSADAGYRMSLTLRSCYPPTGWVLGVPGRSELGTNTRLVI